MKDILRLIVLLVVLGSCAVFDGYKDNQHSWYSKSLSASDKDILNKGVVLEKEIQANNIKGKLLITKGSAKLGKYNFVEVGEWEERFNYSQGDFVKGEAIVKTVYDQYGNILSRVELDKRNKEDEFYKQAVYESSFGIYASDTILTQTITIFNKQGNKVSQYSLGILDYKQRLSDRLKQKIKIGKDYIFDSSGNIKNVNEYKYEDKVKG